MFELLKPFLVHSIVDGQSQYRPTQDIIITWSGQPVHYFTDYMIGVINHDGFTEEIHYDHEGGWALDNVQVYREINWNQK